MEYRICVRLLSILYFVLNLSVCAKGYIYTTDRENGYERRFHQGVMQYNKQVSCRLFNQTNGEYTYWENGIQNNNNTTMEFSEGSIGIAIGTWYYPWDNCEGAYFQDVIVGELLIFNKELSNSERQSVEQYLTIKWGL